MREIKFRAWDRDIHKMFRFDGLLYFSEYNLLAWELKKEDHDPNGGDYFNLSGMESFEVMQYTGLKDKNGVEIYEHDFVDFDNTQMEVIWDETTCKFVFWQKGWSEVHTPNVNCSVIGNKYEGIKAN